MGSEGWEEGESEEEGGGVEKQEVVKKKKEEEKKAELIEKVTSEEKEGVDDEENERKRKAELSSSHLPTKKKVDERESLINSHFLVLQQYHDANVLLFYQVEAAECSLSQSNLTPPTQLFLTLPTLTEVNMLLCDYCIDLNMKLRVSLALYRHKQACR